MFQRGNAMKRIFFTLILCCACAATDAQDAPDADLQAQAATIAAYRAQWAASEAGANTPARRATLAEKLVEYAIDHADTDADLAVYAARKAHEYGHTQAKSYGSAATALHLIQRLQPSAKLETLESVSELYRSAFEENPSVRLGMGVGYADSLALVARERQRLFELEVETGDLTTKQMYQRSMEIQRDWSNARRTIARVITAGKRIESRLAESDEERLILIKAFVARQTRAMDRYTERLDAASEYRKGLALISRVERTTEPNEELRRDAAWQYLCVMGRPDKAKPFADAILPAEQLPMLDIALATDRLDPAQSLQLAEWYVGLSERCPDPLGQRRVLERAVRRLEAIDRKLPDDPTQISLAESIAKQAHARGEALAMHPDLEDITPKSVTTPAEPEPTIRMALADPEPDLEPTRTTTRPSNMTATMERDDHQPTGTTTRRTTGSSGTTAAATPSWLEEEEDGDYFANREKSIFDFGRE